MQLLISSIRLPFPIIFYTWVLQNKHFDTHFYVSPRYEPQCPSPRRWPWIVVAHVPAHLQDELSLGLQVVQQQVGPLVVLPQLEKQAAKVV